MFIRPLLFATALATLATPALAQNAQTINVAMTNYAYTPATLNLHSGTEYKLVFANNSTKSHNFVAPELFAAGTVAPEDKAKVSAKGEVEVDEGQTVAVDFTPSKPGTYPFQCSHFMHAMLGMKGTAVVQ